MDMFILIEGEFRSLIRNSLERIIGARFSKKPNKYMEILWKVSIRAVSSLIAIFAFKAIKQQPHIGENVSYFLVFAFFFFILNDSLRSPSV